MELSLPYHDSYGDSLYNIDAAVYELDEVIGQSDTIIVKFFSTQSFNIKPNPLSTKTFNVNEISDSIIWNEETVSSRLIIDLSESSLVNSIINADLTSNETFVESFKGLYIQSSDSNERVV